MSKKLLFNNVGGKAPADDYTIIEIIPTSVSTVDTTGATELYINDTPATPSAKTSIPYGEKAIVKYKGDIKNFNNIKHFTIKQISTTTTGFHEMFTRIHNSFTMDIDVSNLDSNSITTMENMFYYSSFNLPSDTGNVNISYLYFPSCRSLSGMFDDFTGRYNNRFNNLTFTTCLFAKGVVLSRLFSSCNVTNLSFTNMRIQTDIIDRMFEYCGSADGVLDLTDTIITPASSSGFSLNGICKGCKFPIIDLSGFKGKGNYLYSSFANCTNATKIDIRNITADADTICDADTFKNVPSTCEIIVGKDFHLTEQQLGFTGTFTRV